MKKLLFLTTLVLTSLTTFAQGNNDKLPDGIMSLEWRYNPFDYEGKPVNMAQFYGRLFLNNKSVVRLGVGVGFDRDKQEGSWNKNTSSVNANYYDIEHMDSIKESNELTLKLSVGYEYHFANTGRLDFYAGAEGGFLGKFCSGSYAKSVNNTNVTSQFRQGWGLYNSDGELVEVLFIRYTTTALGNGEYVTVSSRPLNFGAGITSGTYRIMPIYSIYPSEDYKPCIGSDVNYIEVKITSNTLTLIPYGENGNAKYTVNNVTFDGFKHPGKTVKVTVDITNNGTSMNDKLFLFVFSFCQHDNRHYGRKQNQPSKTQLPIHSTKVRLSE